MQKSKKLKTVFCLCAVVTVCALCFSFVIRRAGACFRLADDTALAAALFSYSSGELFPSPTEAPKQPSSVSKKPLTDSKAEDKNAKKLEADEETGEQYPVVETNIVSGNMRYENISLKNATAYTPDIESLLSAPLPFQLGGDHRVQVLIVHTHTCERYMKEDRGYYYDSFYSRTTDPNQSVVAVGEAIADSLKSYGIGTVHDTTLHDYPSYEGSYDRSFDTIQKYLEKYPTIKIVFDIHRDSMTTDDNIKYKPTFEYKGKKAAQIMIMSGHDDYGDFSFWDENLIFATKLQKACEDLYPGMTRPLYFGDFTYNMDVNNGSLLIEVGTDANTVDEAVRAGSYLGNALSSLLKKS